MICCNLQEQKTDSAVYTVGASTNDMTGEITFYKDPSKPPMLEKQPDPYPLRRKYILLLYAKYASAFSEGSFPSRISYEIG